MTVAVQAAAVWVAQVVGTAVGATLTVLGVPGSMALAAAATAANIAYVALYAGLAYAVDAVQRPRQRQLGQELTYNIDPAYPREMVVGVRMVGGSMVARYSKAENRQHAHFVIQVADHPCVELSEVYGDSRLVRGTPLTHGTRTEITAYSNSGGPRVYMTWHDGRPGQTADSDLVSASALDPEVVAGKIPAWTSNHKGAGCAYIHVEVRFDSDILTSIPSFLFLVKGAKFYDRRLDTTAGGSGSHRLDDPSTWAYTTNAAVVWDHYSLGYQVEDDPLAFGIGLSKTELPYAQFEAAADLADEDVETGTGGDVETIKRYAINGVLSSATYFEEQLEDFQFQMAGRIVDLGGRIGLIGAEERTSAVSLTSADLVADEPLQFADKLPFGDLYGTVTGNFSDPANNYQPTPYTPQTSAYALLPDGGEAQSVTIDLPLETHPRRAVRNVSAWLARESLQPRMIAVFTPKAWHLEVGDWFDYTDEGLQVEEAMFEVIDIVKNDDFTVLLTARAIDPDFLAFDNDNDPDLSVPPQIDPADMTIDSPAGTITAISISGGGAVEPAIRFTLTSAADPAREILVELQMWDGAALIGDPIFTSMHSDESTKLIRSGLLPNKQYKARVKARLGVRESAWTSWSSAITTSSTLTSPTSSLASAIVGQGAGATANSLADLNATDDAHLTASYGTAKRLIVSDFTADGRHWTTAFGGTPEAIADPVANGYFNVAGVGRAIRLSADSYLTPKGVIKPVPGRRYLVLARLRMATNPSSGAVLANLQMNGLDTSYNHGAPTFSTITPVNTIASKSSFVVADGLINLAQVFVAGTASTYDAYWRPRVDITQTGAGGIAECFYLDCIDVTDIPVGRALNDLFRTDGSTPLSDASVITLLGTAAAITSQGDLATTNKAALPFGVNAVVNSEFNRDLYGFQDASPGDSGLSFSSYGLDIFGSMTRRYVGGQLSGTPAAGKIVDAVSVDGVYLKTPPQLAGLKKFAMAVFDGDQVYASAKMKGLGVDLGYAMVTWCNATGSEISTTTLGGSAINTSGGYQQLSTYNRIGGVATAPSGARWAFVFFRARLTATANPWFVITEPFMCRVPAGQTAAPEYSAGRDDPLGDQTGVHTAAAITSQGALAVLNDAGVFAYATPTSGDVDNAAYNSKASKSITTDGGPVEIEFFAYFDEETPSLGLDPVEQHSVLARLKRGSTTLIDDLPIVTWTTLGADKISPPRQPGRLFYVDQPSAGTYTYEIFLKTTVPGDFGSEAASMVNAGQIFRIVNPQTAANAIS